MSAQGDLTGGVKKKSGVSIDDNIAKVWGEVRDDATDTCFLVVSYASKNAVKVESKGSDMQALLKILQDNGDKCLFGGFRDQGAASGGASAFKRFVFVGDNVGAMARGRAMMHRNAVFSELDGAAEDFDWRGSSDAKDDLKL